jgi:signal transduction histidine kinase
VAIIVWQAIAYARYFMTPTPVRAAEMTLPHAIADAFLIIQVAAACTILFRNSRRLELTRERSQTKWLLWGIVVGLTPYVLLRTLPQLLGLSPLFGSQVDRIFELAIPTAFVIAVVRYRFLDIDIIIRRSLIYGILAAGVVVIYLLLGVVVGRRLEATGETGIWISLPAIGLLAGVLFHPTRRLIGRWVDRHLFKIRHNYEVVLNALENRLSQASSQYDVIAALVWSIEATLEPRRMIAVVTDDPDLLIEGGLDRETAIHAWHAWREWKGAEWRCAAAPNRTSLPELERDDFPSTLLNHDLVLAQGIWAGEEILGVLLLAPRRTERRYVEPDLETLARATERAGRAVERLRLTQTAAEEALARRQLDELNRLKSDFLSRVAHDLRTPLASIGWSTSNLRDGIAGEVNTAQSDYLGSIQRSVRRLDRMVGNLLEISRLDRGTIELDRQPVKLEAVIEDTTQTLRFLAEEKNITIAVKRQGESRAVLADADTLFEVVVNLLDNALRYSPEGETVSITIGDLPGGRYGFSVHDSGPGLGTTDPASLFARFAQGGPSPHARDHGFGLGLHIVRSYVELMNGGVEARNHPGGGAEFTCWFRGTAEAQEDRP